MSDEEEIILVSIVYRDSNLLKKPIKLVLVFLERIKISKMKSEKNYMIHTKKSMTLL